jgi:hypothetical protein
MEKDSMLLKKHGLIDYSVFLIQIDILKLIKGNDDASLVYDSKK